MVRPGIGKVISYLKWIRWLFKAFSLITAMREIVNFLQATHVIMKLIRSELDKICSEEEAKVTPEEVQEAPKRKIRI